MLLITGNVVQKIHPHILVGDSIQGSLMLTYFLFKNGKIENPSCSASCYLIQNISHHILHCPATYSFCRSLFGELLSLYELLFRPWKWPGFWGSTVFYHVSIPRKGSGNYNENINNMVYKPFFKCCRCYQV